MNFFKEEVDTGGRLKAAVEACPWLELRRPDVPLRI